MREALGQASFIRENPANETLVPGQLSKQIVVPRALGVELQDKEAEHLRMREGAIAATVVDSEEVNNCQWRQRFTEGCGSFATSRLDVLRPVPGGACRRLEGSWAAGGH